MLLRPSLFSFARLARSGFVLAGIVAGSVFAAAPAFIRRNPAPLGVSLQGVTFANGRFVAVGNAGTVLNSTDAGVTWHAVSVSTTSLNAVAFGGGLWLAVGDGGRIYTSADATTWTARTSTTGQQLHAVTFATNQYLAAGTNGAILTSPDGITWTSRTSGTTQNLQGIAGRTGAHVAVGFNNTLLRSPDGITWTAHPLAEPTSELRSAAILNNQFVVGGRNARIYTSPDGVTWTSRANNGVTGFSFEAVAFDGTQYVINSFGGQFFPTTNFTNRPAIVTTFNPTVPRSSIAYGAGTFVSVGQGGDIATSTDGRTWVQRGTTGAEYRLRCVAALNGQWFSAGTNATIYSSPDGVSWTRSTHGGSDQTETLGLAYGAGRYVGVGTSGLVISSTDGAAWTASTTASGVTRTLFSLTFGNGRFVAVGGGGVVTTSTDGQTWTPRTSGVTADLTTVVTLGNRYVAAGDGGVIIASTDGATWTRATSGVTADLTAACIYNGTAYVVGAGRTILASADGQTWVQRAAPGTGNSTYNAIAVAHGGLVVALDDGAGLYSPNGTTWSATPQIAFGERPFAAGSDGTTAMVVGTGGVIVQTVDTALPPSRVINVATRGLVQAGSALTPGFVLRGAGSKQVVVRAIGPTLSTFGLNGLADLKLDVVNQQTSAVAATNDDWGGSAALANRFASLGAFALGATSKDAAVQTSLPVNAGGYSVRITAAGTAAAGVALAEVYDGDADDSPVRVVNVSTLGFVGANENVLTPGFVIRGAVPKRVLIRAIGPGLAQLGVTGLLGDPQFSVFPSGSSVAIAGNNDWGATTELKAAFTAAGAFTIPDASRDAAVVVTLPAGAYTVVASGVGNTTGTAIVEVYDLDP